MSIKQKQSYNCTVCDLICSTKFNYVRHLTSEKHQLRSNIVNNYSVHVNNLSSTENKTPINDCNSIKGCEEKNMETIYSCDYCKFITKSKKESNKHRTSKQHKNNEHKEEDFIEIVNKYVCLSCDKTYDKYISCWKHSKQCKKENIVLEIAEQAPSPEINTQVIDIEAIKKELFKEVYSSVVEKIMENNQNTISKIVESNQNTLVKITESLSQNQQALTQTNTHTNNYTNNNSNNNNHCTINMFLNEKCKDAMNITDWAKQLQVDYEHLYYTGENGFQKGLTNMLVENLKLCDVYNRPIHFTDVKRDRMYIRDADEWTKHENTDKLNEVLEISARQACIRLTDWMKEHEDVPEYHDLDSELGQQYLALMVSVIRPQVEREKAFPKVIKELAKTAQLKKEDQV